MKYLFYILLSVSLTTFGTVASEGPVDELKKTETYATSEAAEDTAEDMVMMESEHENACCTDVETCSRESCDSSQCSASAELLEMPAVGLYAPLLTPQKPKMSLAKEKMGKPRKKKKAAATATEALKP